MTASKRAARSSIAGRRRGVGAEAVGEEAVVVLVEPPVAPARPGQAALSSWPTKPARTLSTRVAPRHRVGAEEDDQVAGAEREPAAPRLAGDERVGAAARSRRAGGRSAAASKWCRNRLATTRSQRSAGVAIRGPVEHVGGPRPRLPAGLRRRRRWSPASTSGLAVEQRRARPRASARGAGARRRASAGRRRSRSRACAAAGRRRRRSRRSRPAPSRAHARGWRARP